MYIKKVSIQNIRSIDHFEMEFEEPAGWHVIIGDNGSGKSTVVKTISYALVGPREVAALDVNINNWRAHGHFGSISLDIVRDQHFDGINGSEKLGVGEDANELTGENFLFKSDIVLPKLLKKEDSLSSRKPQIIFNISSNDDTYHDWGMFGWFSAGFGPFRRFSGDRKKDEPNLLAGAHKSIFNDNVAFSEALDWIERLDHERLMEEKTNGQKSTLIYSSLLKFINESSLLPHNTKIEGVNQEGIVFIDGNGNYIPVLELSDGYRSILSLIFELIRQLIRVYGGQNVFSAVEKGNMYIDLPGVVLIDEVGAHQQKRRS